MSVMDQLLCSGSGIALAVGVCLTVLINHAPRGRNRAHD